MLTIEAFNKLIKEKGLRRAVASLLADADAAKQSEQGQTAAIMMLAEVLERTEKQTRETAKACQFLSGVVAGMQPETAEGATTESAPEDGDDRGGRPQDQTPFPTGVKTSGPQANASLDDVEAAANPDAGSGPARNANPIPGAVKNKNGSKVPNNVGKGA